MSFFAHNMRVLERVAPALARTMAQAGPYVAGTVERARSGAPTLKAGGILLHSAYDPEREAADWVAPLAVPPEEPLTVLGMGLGYHLRRLAAAGVSGTVIEPSPELFRLALEQSDLTSALERFRPLVGVPVGTLRRAHRDQLAVRTVSHPASRRLAPDYIAPLEEYAGALGAVRRGGLRILVVNPVSGGSLPAARHCTAALRSLGHEVMVFAAEEFAAGMEFCDRFTHDDHRKTALLGLENYLSDAVAMMAAECQPDLVLALAQAPLVTPALRQLSAMGIATAFWFVEDYRLLRYWRRVAPDYGCIFTIQQGEFEEELRQCGARHHAYLPTAAAPEIHRPLQLTPQERDEYGADLSFVGAAYHNRLRFFRGLLDHQLQIWGSGWPLTPPFAAAVRRQGERIDTETCVRIFNATAINLNLHSSTCHEGVDPAGDFVNPRTFELASCGAFQLVDRRRHLPDLFTDEEQQTFITLAELRDQIDHYRTRPDERRELAARARRRTLAEHTYEARMEELLAVMVGAYPDILARRDDRTGRTAASRTSLADLPGMAPILERIPPDRHVDLPAIYEAIGSGTGTLTREERIFLMLRNIGGPAETVTGVDR